MVSIDWNDVRKAIYPAKDYDDLCRRFEESISYAFIHETFNFTMPELVRYTELILLGDSRGRYNTYATMLIETFTELYESGVKNFLDLLAKAGSSERLEVFVRQSQVDAADLAAVLKFLFYWFLPTQKPLGGLVGNHPYTSEAVWMLRQSGIRTNLDMLQQGITSAGRKAIVKTSGLPEETVTELVHRADFSRLPWASKATISNIMGAGYGSLGELASANPEKLYEDFYRYGKSIGKNLKLGNEIENSYRIAKIVPALVQEP